MLCRSCTEAPHQEARGDLSPRTPSQAWWRVLLFRCVGCGSALSEIAIQELFTAKVRQLEQFGFALESPRAEPTVRPKFYAEATGINPDDDSRF